MNKELKIVGILAILIAVMFQPVSALSTIAYEYRTYPSVMVPGIEGIIEITLTNIGDRPIENVNIFKISSEKPLEIADFKRNVGDLSPGLSKKIILKLKIPEQTESGFYLVDVILGMSVLGSAERYEFQIPIEVREESVLKFSISPERIEHDTPVNLTLKVENMGGDVKNLRILWYGEGVIPISENSALFVSSLKSNEYREFNLRVKAVKPGTSILVLNVSYNDASGNHVYETRSIAIDVVSKNEGFLDVSLNPTTLKIGKEGTISFNLEAKGNEEMKNILFRWKSDTIMPSSSDSEFIDSLNPGESVSVAFEVFVNENIVPGYYPLNVEVQYDYSGMRVEKEESFSVKVVGDISLTTTLFRAESDKVFISIANTGNAPVKNLVVYADSRYGKGEVFLGDMDPGDEEIIEIDQRNVDTSKPYNISLKLEYRDVFGESYSEIQEVNVHHFSQKSSSAIIMAGVAILALVVAGAWILRRR